MFESGSLFGKYRILNLIGRGGMGIVYLAEDTTLGRQVAIKVLDRAVTEEGQFELRFQREARIVASLQHPHIVPIHALERVGDQFAIDMPYIDGGSLADVLEGGNGKRARTLACVWDTLGALASCHREGIVHRDVKPSNILVRSDGVSFLSDFGLAKLMAEQQAASLSLRSSSGLFLGTPRYAPPESWEGQEAAPSWDVYSIGLVLYEAFAPRFPYDAATPMGLVKQILERPIPSLEAVAEGISAELSQAVSAMIDRDPEKRPEDAGVALERLAQTPEWNAQASAGATVVSPLPRRIPRRRRRHVPRMNRLAVVRGLVVLALSAAIGIGASLVVNSTRSGNGREADVTPTTEAVRELDPKTVFNTLDTATGNLWANHVLLVASPGSTQWAALACESTEVWSLQIDAAHSSFLQVSGEWARYRDRAASLFEHGDVTGTGRWVAPNEELSLSLEFRNIQDGDRETKAFVLKRGKDGMGENDFLTHFVSQDFALPLLYNEVIPRNLSWGKDVETVFLSNLSSCLVVPILQDGGPEVVVDGRIGGPEWGHLVLENPDDAGTLTEEGGDPGKRLLVRYDAEGLYVAATINVPVAEPTIALAVMPQVQIPAKKSPRYSLLLGKEGLREGRRAVEERQVPWQCNPRSAVSSSSNAWEMEVFIPFADPQGLPAPRPWSRWWLNCAVYDGADAGEPPVAQWGALDWTDVRQGVILVFGAPEGT